jgi:hypothetical protein
MSRGGSEARRVSWSVICLALLEDGLWLKKKAKELVLEGKKDWPRGVILRSGLQQRATMSVHVARP